MVRISPATYSFAMRKALLFLFETFANLLVENLKIRMTQKRLNGLAFLHINRDNGLTVKEVINCFAKGFKTLIRITIFFITQGHQLKKSWVRHCLSVNVGDDNDSNMTF